MSICDKILTHSINLGVNECESILSSKKILTVRIIDSEIAEIKENQEKTVGVRLVSDRKIGTVKSTTLEPTKIIERALRIAQNTTKRDFWKSFPPQTRTKHIEKTNDQKIWDLNSTKMTEIAQIMIDSAKHKKISRISGSLNAVCDDFELCNTSGLQKSEKATYVFGTINVDSDDMVSGIGHDCSRTLADFDAKKIGERALDMCINSLNPKICEPQTTNIIFDPLAVGELLFFVFGPNFSLRTYSENRSCFSQKIGNKIATSEFSLLDDPHVPNGLGTKSFDDEGTPTKITHYIKDGVMLGTYSDLYNSFKEQTTSSGNACRFGIPLGRSSEPIPVPAPHNLTINPGMKSRDEIIKNVKNGILVSRLWYTYPINPIKGDFSCTARSGIWVIKDGQIKNSAKPFRIIHNLPDLLQGISGIGNNPETVLSWAAMPVTAPTICCNGITINPI